MSSTDGSSISNDETHDTLEAATQKEKSPGKRKKSTTASKKAKGTSTQKTEQIHKS